MKKSRKVTAALVFGTLLSFGPAVAEQANVVFLFADDLGYGSVSSYGSDIPTPNIDSIGHNGVRFTSGYMTAPVCNPSRHGLMTGRYQQRWGKELNSQTVPPLGQKTNRHLPRDQKTIADAMKAAGYRTGAFGKWQLSLDDGFHPLDRGFDTFVGMESGMSHVDPRWPDARVAPRPQSDDVIYSSAAQRAARQNQSPDDPKVVDERGLKGLFRGREPVELEELLTERLAREGVEFIERNKDRPFFLYLPFYSPHAPIQTTEKYYQRFPHIENEGRRIYAGMISAVDDAVGSVLAKLREEGLEEKTLVIFASDNGASKTYDIGLVANLPLIGHKRNLYGGGIRIPYLMQWKGRIPAGQTYTHPVSSLDLFPTFLAAAGEDDASRYKLDGVNLLPYLKGESAGVPHDYLFWRSGPNGAVRHAEWKLLMIGSEMTRLYNADKDPGESKDLSSKRPELVGKMKQAHERWSKEMAASRESSRKVRTEYNNDEIDWHI